jgi:hypothetical protein
LKGEWKVPEYIKREDVILITTETGALETQGRVRALPAAHVQHVVHGKWIGWPECLQYDGAYSDDQIVCSSCHKVWNLIDNCTEDFNFCPNCGAYMVEES